MAVCSLHHSVKRTDKHVVWSFDGFEWRAHTNKSTALTSQLKLTQLKWFVNGGQICVSRRRSANTCPNITNTYTKTTAYYTYTYMQICNSCDQRETVQTTCGACKKNAFAGFVLIQRRRRCGRRHAHPIGRPTSRRIKGDSLVVVIFRTFLLFSAKSGKASNSLQARAHQSF